MIYQTVSDHDRISIFGDFFYPIFVIVIRLF